MNENPDLRIYAYDYSPHAVKLVQVGPLMLRPALFLTTPEAEPDVRGAPPWLNRGRCMGSQLPRRHTEQPTGSNRRRRDSRIRYERASSEGVASSC